MRLEIVVETSGPDGETRAERFQLRGGSYYGAGSKPILKHYTYQSGYVELIEHTRGTWTARVCGRDVPGHYDSAETALTVARVFEEQPGYLDDLVSDDYIYTIDDVAEIWDPVA